MRWYHFLLLLPSCEALGIYCIELITGYWFVTTGVADEPDDNEWTFKGNWKSVGHAHQISSFSSE